MEIKVWHEGMTLEDTKNLAYWERNVLALKYADGWYNDDVIAMFDYPDADGNVFQRPHPIPRYKNWRRVLSLEGGKITFHIPDDFDVGNLPQIERNWDGHSTEEKWKRILAERGI